MMGERTTKKDIANATERLCAAHGLRIATAWNDVGGIIIDYNPTYGGVGLYRVTSDHGAQHQVHSRRLSPREYVEACRFACAIHDESES